MSTGNKLLQLIKKKDMKQIVLAQHLGISPSRLSNYLSGKRDMDLRMLAKAAKYLSADLNYFADINFTELEFCIYDVTEELIVGHRKSQEHQFATHRTFGNTKSLFN